MATDATVGLNETTTPTKFIDNELYTNSFSQVTYRQRVSDVDSRAVLSNILTAAQGATPAGANVIGAVTQSGTWTVTASGTVAISGSVAVTGTFWQATQPVSGTFWQVTQPVSGTFWQTTQPVSLASLPALAAGSAVIGHVIVDTAPTTAITASALPLPSGAATAAKQPALGTAGSSSTDVLSIQGVASGTPIPISGSITATNPSVSATGSAIPASATMTGVSDGTTLRAMSGDASGRPNVNINGTVPVSAASLPLPTGAALDATLTGGTQQAKITDGATVASVVAVGTGQNAVATTLASKEVSFTTTTAQAVGATDCMNYRSVSVHVFTQGGSSIVTFQGSNDVTFANVTSIALMPQINVGANVASVNTASANVLYSGPLNFRYFRLNVTGITSGTTAGVIEFSSAPYAGATVPQTTITGTVTGNVGNTANTTPILAAAATQAVTTNSALMTKVISAATTNGTNIKASAGNVYGYHMTNTTAAFKFLKFYNKASAPTVGTDTPVALVGLPPNSTTCGDIAYGAGFATGIGYGITGASPDADTTATAVGDVVGVIFSK